MSIERTAWEEKVLANFLVGERLKRLPARWKKRMVVLRWLVEEFEPDRRYPQSEVNRILARHHPDVALIRREFVVYGLMDRKDGVYWRIGEPRSDVD